MHFSVKLLILITFFNIAAAPYTHAENESKTNQSYSEFNGKIIRSISVKVRDIFDEQQISGIYAAANKLKANTKEQVVLKELLFKEGEKFDEFIFKESERNLRILGFLRNIKLTPKAEGDVVDIEIEVQDTWTIIPQFGYSSGTGNQKLSLGMAESDLLGLGKRVEVLYEDDNKRSSYSAVVDDNRVWGTFNRFIGGAFERNDGYHYFFFFGKPFRSLVEHDSWSSDFDISDTVGRLFENGDERFLFRRKHLDTGIKYTIASGDPRNSIGRYSIGYRYQEDRFSEADLQDFSDLDVDPDSVSRDPALLAENRRFSGLSLGYQQIQPYYISMNYIDRFDRVADYNLGNTLALTALLAPTLLGSSDNAGILSAKDSVGFHCSESSFIRGELGAGSRVEGDGFSNSLIRSEIKYYNVLGLWEPRGIALGRHTFAASLSLDYGTDLDLDREFLLGADNGLRGYDARTFTGDKRLILNLEHRVHIVDDAFKFVSVGAAAFFDAGGSTTDKFSDLIGNNIYSDFGVGLRFAFPRSTGSRVFRIDLAYPLRDGPDGSDRMEPRLILSGGQLFNSLLRSETDGPEQASAGIGFDR